MLNIFSRIENEKMRMMENNICSKVMILCGKIRSERTSGKRGTRIKNGKIWMAIMEQGIMNEKIGGR